VSGTGEAKWGSVAISCGHADLRNDGVYNQDAWGPYAGHDLLGRTRRVAAERNGDDVFADEHLSFDPMATAALSSTKRLVLIPN
jgi:hypothetical protein